LDGRGKAQWLGFLEGKSTIFVGWGGVIAFIFRLCGRNRTLHPFSSTNNMTIKRRTMGFMLKRLGDGVAASFLLGCFWINFPLIFRLIDVLRPGRRIRSHCPVANLYHTTINQCTRGRRLERPGDCFVFTSGFWTIFRLGGRIEVKADHLSACLSGMTSLKPIKFY